MYTEQMLKKFQGYSRFCMPMKEKVRRNKNFQWSQWEKNLIIFATKGMNLFLLFIISQPTVRLV
jgi:hypothetical protein